MAGVVTVTAGLRIVNGTNGILEDRNIGPLSLVFAQATAAPARVDGTQTIGFAAHEALALTDLTTLGWCYFRNRDATNFVQLGVDVGGTFYPLLRIEPNEIALFRMTQGITPYAQAAAAAVILERMIFDD